MIPYTKHWITQEDRSAVSRALRSPYVTRGPLTERFEAELCKQTGAKYCVAVNSGTAALRIARRCQPFGAAMIPPITFCATANAFCDTNIAWARVDPETGLYANGTQLGVCTVTVDLQGRHCDYARLRTPRPGAFLVRDAAHAFPRNGIQSDVCILSFHPAKHITTGEGGAVLTDDRGLYERALCIRNNGLWPGDKRQQVEIGGNYHMPEASAALGLSQLNRLDAILKKRRAWAEAYTQALRGCKAIKTPPPAEAHDHHLYAVAVQGGKRDQLRAFLRTRQITTACHYPPLFSEPAFSHTRVLPDVRRAAEAYASATLSLPLFPTMKGEEFSRVVDAILYWSARQ